MSITSENILSHGLTASKWVELLNTTPAVKTKKALTYYDGNQEEEVIKLLSDPLKGRQEWQTRGYIPRFRNITKMIVDKSAMLFKDVLPVFNIFPPGSKTPDKSSTDKLNEYFATTELQETFQNLDAVVRLVKTGLLLVQYTPDGFIFDILHRGNCSVIIDPTTKQPDALIYQVSDDENYKTYRVITLETIYDLRSADRGVIVVDVQPNPYGIIPVVPFYDTNIPRNGFWAEGGQDLVGLNELINLHLTDAEFSMSWAIRPTLFTNCSLNNNSERSLEVAEVYGSALPRLVPSLPKVLSGPDRAVVVDTQGVDQPFIKFEAPQVDIAPIAKVITDWLQSFASDWSVNIKTAGSGTATSGFQLVVEEIDNLQLRQTRQRMFEAGFKRLYKVMSNILTALNEPTLPITSELYATFQEVKLPVDVAVSESVWTERITQGRASIVDYFMKEQGMSIEEAEKKLKEINSYKTPEIEVINNQ